MQDIVRELKAKGTTLKATEQPIAKLRAEGLGETAIAKRLGIDRASVYRLQKDGDERRRFLFSGELGQQRKSLDDGKPINFITTH